MSTQGIATAYEMLTELKRLQKECERSNQAAETNHEKYIELRDQMDMLINGFRAWFYSPDVLRDDGTYCVPAALVDEWVKAIEAVAA